ncbi:hypothetical protein GEMRC1_004547 [Eukaryota sp. GEM-RC1]
MLEILAGLLPNEHHYLLHDCPDVGPTDIISLNIVKRYRNHLKPSVRENLQNWRDQCFKQAKSHDPQNPFPSPSVNAEVHENFKGSGVFLEIYSAWFQNQLLGLLIQTRSSTSSVNQTHDIIFYNSNTILAPEILRFGHSDKENEPCLAGHFGDGLKPEINRLLATGASFRIKTGPSTWSFAHDSNDSLFCYVNKNPALVSCPPATMIHISGIRDTTVRVDPTKYLFLQSDEQLGPVIRYLMPNKRVLIRFLLQKSFLNKIYFHGIYVSTFQYEEFPFGLDYNATLSSESGLGVERNKVDTHFMVAEILTAAASMQKYKDHGLSNEMFNELRFLVYKALSSMSYIYLNFSRCADILGQFLLEGFMLAEAGCNRLVYQQESPASALLVQKIIIPMSRPEIDDYKDELELFQCKHVEIKNTQLLELLRSSPNCPLIGSIRSNYTNQFLGLPEYITRGDVGLPYPTEIKNIVKISVFPSVEADLLAAQLRDLLVDLVDDPVVLPKWAIRFKQFPPTKTPKAITPLKVQKYAFYVVDISQFSQNHVHQIFKREDSSYECTGDNCSCVHDYFFEQLLKAIDSVFPGSNRKDKVTKKLQRRLMSLLSPLPTHQDIPMPEPVDLTDTNSPSGGNSPVKGPKPPNLIQHQVHKVL